MSFIMRRMALTGWYRREGFMLEIIRREAVYLWYYFSVQLEQLLPYWVLGMVLGSAVSVFLKDIILFGH